MDNLLNLVFPKKCFKCGRSGKLICYKCATSFKLFNSAFCVICQKQTSLTTPHFCYPNSLPAYSYFDYSGDVRNLIKKSKFGLNTFSYVADLTLAMCDEALLLQFLKSFPRPHVLVPIPASKQNINKRGFDLPIKIAAILSKKFNIEVRSAALVRIRLTEHQSELTRIDRFDNIKDAFSFDLSKVSGVGTVFFVDDIITSGATMISAADALGECTGSLPKVACISLSRRLYDKQL